jgi:hypothetical protein
VVRHQTNEFPRAAPNLTKVALLSIMAAVSLVSAARAEDRKPESYLAVWGSDKETDDNHLDPIFWRLSTQIRDRRITARS